MLFKYLGTAAAEGVPAPFCPCENCQKARKAGGKELRSRSQAIIDGKLLIDLPPDTAWHAITNGIDLSTVRDVLITHTHSDHYYPTELCYLKKNFCNLPDGFPPLNVYGNEHVYEKGKDIFDSLNDRLSFRLVKPFEPFSAADYTVTPLKAVHGAPDSLVYIISDGKKTVLYSHDTDVFRDDTWEYLAKEKPLFDFISLDCTEGAKESLHYVGHLCLGTDVIMKKRLADIGVIDGHTKIVLNHFSHNGLNAPRYELLPIAAKHGFELSYDGMEIEI